MPEFGMQTKFELLKCPIELTVNSSYFKPAEMFTFWITEGRQTINLKLNRIYVIYMAIKH